LKHEAHEIYPARRWQRAKRGMSQNQIELCRGHEITGFNVFLVADTTRSVGLPRTQGSGRRARHLSIHYLSHQNVSFDGGRRMSRQRYTTEVYRFSLQVSDIHHRTAVSLDLAPSGTPPVVRLEIRDLVLRSTFHWSELDGESWGIAGTRVEG